MAGDPPPGVCGPRTRVVCGWVYEHTGGNRPLAIAADWVVGRPLAIAGLLAAGWVLRWIVRRVVARAVQRLLVRRPVVPLVPVPDDDALPAGVPPREAARRGTRAEAVAASLSSLLSTLVWIGVLIAGCGVLGVDLEPLIAGAGLAGVALAFGAQSVIRDLLAGFFILLEDHFAIGDEVDLGDAVGTVERMTFRVTVLRDLDGTVWHVRNGLIDRVGNLSQVWSGAMVDVAVAHGTDLPRARRLLHEVANALAAEPPFAGDVLEPPEVLGVESMDADGITFRLRVKTRAGRQFDLQRALLERVAVACARSGVHLATPQLTVHPGYAAQVPTARDGERDGAPGGPPR